MSNINHRGEKLHHKIHRHAIHHVHRLRGKSETHRKAVSFGIALVFTLVVFMLWYFLSLPKILEAYQVKQSENKRLDNNPLNKVTDIFKNEEVDTGVSNIDIVNTDNVDNVDNIEITQ